jgi:hypothetical protein
MVKQNRRIRLPIGRDEKQGDEFVVEGLRTNIAEKQSNLFWKHRVTLQSWVASRKGLKSGVKAKRCPGPWGPGRSAWNHEALISSWGGRGRIALRRAGAFSEFLLIPADASGAYRPNPQATTELAPGHPSLKGYQFGEFGLDIPCLSL